MRSLVWRYGKRNICHIFCLQRAKTLILLHHLSKVTTMHRQQEMSQVTEDDVNEVKGDISTLRFELLDVFKNNGMDISSANKNSKGIYQH